MPLYEYECEACHHRFEVIQKFSDPAPEACPRCGGAVQKRQSAPAFQFKGTGWYVTDYAKKDQGGSTKAADSKAEGKTEGKSASESSDSSEKTDASTKSEKAEKSGKPADSSSGSSAASGTSSGTPSAPAAKN
jgi:putative FmdB family regulatory protein